MPEEKEHHEKKHEQAIQKPAPAYGITPFEEMDRMFERMFPRGWMRPFRWEWPELPGFEARIPRVDVIDRDSDILLRAEIPGVRKEDLDISVSDDSVTIKGSTAFEEKEERENFLRREITRGAFSRTVGLPATVDTEQAKAQFKEGMLELTLPKVEKAKRRKITVE